MNSVPPAAVPLDLYSPPPGWPATSSEKISPLVEVPHDVRENQIYRDALLAQPPEFFSSYCQGRNPDLFERMHLVERLVQAVVARQIFVNDVYRVYMRRESPLVHLIVCRRDAQPCKNWLHFQQIKNALVGPECEAVELFPAESRLVDLDNEYHMWVHEDPSYRFGFGYERRHVLREQVLYRGRGGEEQPASNGSRLLADGLAGSLS